MKPLVTPVEHVIAAEVHDRRCDSSEIRRTVDVHRARQRRIALTFVDADHRAVDDEIGTQIGDHFLNCRRIGDVEIAMSEARRAEMLHGRAADQARCSRNDNPHQRKVRPVACSRSEGSLSRIH